MTKTTQLEQKGWVKQFTIEEDRVEEFAELYESLGQEVHIEVAIPSELEGDCKVCYESECTKYRIIYTRQKQHTGNEKDVNEFEIF